MTSSPEDTTGVGVTTCVGAAVGVATGADVGVAAGADVGVATGADVGVAAGGVVAVGPGAVVAVGCAGGCVGVGDSAGDVHATVATASSAIRLKANPQKPFLFTGTSGVTACLLPTWTWPEYSIGRSGRGIAGVCRGCGGRRRPDFAVEVLSFPSWEPRDGPCSPSSPGKQRRRGWWLMGLREAIRFPAPLSTGLVDALEGS